jgi:CHAT domain-containing protein
LIQQFSLGNIATNLEIAIAGYQVVLTGFNFDAFPEVWADTQDNLASAYQNRIRGNIAENLELSIAAYTEALKVRTFDKFPKDWADTQNNLANTYAKRIRGDKAENLELAIAAYTEALKVRTFDNSPEDWATTQHNLALAYSNRIRGDKAENLELSIATCNEALKVRTIDRIPLGWANTKNTLAGNYADRIKGDKAENLELAIKLYNEVLQVRTYDKFPWGWAGTQVDLANAYAKRIREDKEDNLEKSINYCQEALRFYTFDTHPQQWAATKNNLAISYLDRIKENKEDNLELAIAALIESLKVTTFDEFPQQWAITQLNLGNAFHKRIKGDKVKNLEKAIECYNNALKILTKDNDPLSCLKPADNLGQLYYKQKQWQLAIESYNIAIEAIENIRLEAFNPQRRQEILADRIEIFHRIVLAHLKLNQPEKALEYIERSKTRNLVELMTQKNIKPQGVSQEIIDQLDELRQRWVNEQIRLQSRSINQNISSNDKLMPYISDDSHLREYRQAWEDFIDEKITPIDPSFKQTQIVQPISFTDIQSLTDAETCLLQWYITGEKILAFVVPSNGDIKYWESSETDLQTFFDTVGNYLQLYDDFRNHKNTQWKNKLSNLLQTFADTLNLNGILALIPDTCQRLIIIPHRFLHILPLHALPVSDSPLFNGGRGKSELHDLFPKGVQYAPSCQLLKIAQQRQLNDLNQLFAIQNPTKDLTFTDLEVNIISTLFNQSEIIAKDHATKDNVTSHLKASDSHCHHFSCHGGFNPGNSLDSALLLANKELLTLGEIFELNFKKSRLVVLSACETGLIDLNSISDEYVGLPSGFLFAGSPSVVSSLWTVNDLSTSFLMIKLYEILFDENQQVSVPVALKQAQYWLQDLTIDKLDEFLQQYQPQIDKHLVQLRPGQRKIYQKSLERIRERQPYPFANPYYWAGFTATGI